MTNATIDIKWSINTSTRIDIPFNDIKDILIKYASNELTKNLNELEQL